MFKIMFKTYFSDSFWHFCSVFAQFRPPRPFHAASNMTFSRLVVVPGAKSLDQNILYQLVIHASLWRSLKLQAEFQNTEVHWACQDVICVHSYLGFSYVSYYENHFKNPSVVSGKCYWNQELSCMWFLQTAAYTRLVLVTIFQRFKWY